MSQRLVDAVLRTELWIVLVLEYDFLGDSLCEFCGEIQ